MCANSKDAGTNVDIENEKTRVWALAIKLLPTTQEYYGRSFWGCICSLPRRSDVKTAAPAAAARSSTTRAPSRNLDALAAAASTPAIFRFHTAQTVLRNFRGPFKRAAFPAEISDYPSIEEGRPLRRFDRSPLGPFGFRV